MMARRWSGTVTIAAVLLLAAGAASANLVMNYKQDGGDVVMTLQGSVSTAGWVHSSPLGCGPNPLNEFHHSPGYDTSFGACQGTTQAFSFLSIGDASVSSGFPEYHFSRVEAATGQGSPYSVSTSTREAGTLVLDGNSEIVDAVTTYSNTDLAAMFGGLTGSFVFDIESNPGETLTITVEDATVGDVSVCPVDSFADADTTTGPASLSIDSADDNDNVDIVVTVPVASGRTVLDTTPLVLGTTGDAACSVAPTSTECADTDTNNVLTYNVAYATLRTCSPDPATITSDDGDTRYDFGDNENVKAIERLTTIATVSFTEESQYDRDPDPDTEVLITDTRTISQDMAFFVQTPTVITQTLDIEVFDDHNVDLVITSQTVTLSNVGVDATDEDDDTVSMQADVSLTLRLQSWAKVTSVVYHASEAVPAESAIATGTAPNSPPAHAVVDGYSTHTVNAVYTLAGSEATGCDMSGDYKLTITVGCVTGTDDADCPLSAADAAETHDLSFTIATQDVCPITGGTADGFTVVVATFYATQDGGDASTSPVGGFCQLSNDVPTGAASGAFVDDHQICVLSTVTDGDLATAETYISKITSGKASDTSADLRQDDNELSAGTDHKIDVERVAASDVYDGVSFDQDASTGEATLTVEVTAVFGSAKRRSLLSTETAAASTTVTVSKAAVGGLGEAASSLTVVTGVAGTVVVAVVVVAVVMMAAVVAVAFVAISRVGKPAAAKDASSGDDSSSATADSFFPVSTSVNADGSASSFFPVSTSASASGSSSEATV